MSLALVLFKWHGATIIQLRGCGCKMCTDTSDLGQFGPKTFRHHKTDAEVSRHFGTSAEVSGRQFGTGAKLLLRILVGVQR